MALFALAQRFFAAAAILARAWALTFRFGFLVELEAAETSAEEAAGLAALPPRALAQRARCAAAIRSRASGDIVRFPLPFAGLDTIAATGARPLPASNDFNSVSNFSICSLSWIARCSCCVEGRMFDIVTVVWSSIAPRVNPLNY